MSESFDAIVPDTGEVVTFQNGRPVLPGRATDVGLDLPPGLSFGEWSSIGAALQGAQRSMMWWIGDWYRYGEERYGEDATQAVEEFGYSPETVRKAVFVANRIAPVFRVPNLSWSHHRAAAELEDVGERSEVLREAEDQKLRVSDLRAEVRRRKGLPDPAPRGAPEPEPEPIPGEIEGAVAKLKGWLIDGSRLRATFKSGQVAALRAKECGVHLDPDRIDVLMEFLGVLHHTLTADREADEQAEGVTAGPRPNNSRERSNGSVGTRA